MARSVDSSQTSHTSAGLSVAVVDLVGSAFFGAGTDLVCEKSALAIAVLSSGVVLRVDRAGHAISAGNKVIVRACLARASVETESWVALT